MIRYAHNLQKWNEVRFAPNSGANADIAGMSPKGQNWKS